MNHTDKSKLWAETASGRSYRPFVMDPASVHLDDVIAALSKTCRFNGHCKSFYSVAEHSVLVGEIVVRHLERPDLLWPALMHDSPEAYVGDMIAPIKRGLVDYRILYDLVESAVYDALGVSNDVDWNVVLKADLMALAVEAEALLPSKGATWELPFPTPQGFSIQCLPPAEAHVFFETACRLAQAQR
jgi:uncharacterized protein